MAALRIQIQNISFKSLHRRILNTAQSTIRNKSCAINLSSRFLAGKSESLCIKTRRSSHLVSSPSLLNSNCFNGHRISFLAPFKLTSSCSFIYESSYTQHRMFSLSSQRNQQKYDPNQADRRQKLMLFTYISCFIGACLLGTIGYQQFGKMSKRAVGIEEIKIREYGLRPHLYRYRGFVYTDFVVNDVKSIHKFEVREDDVWIVSYPKSGTTWVQEIAYLINSDLDFEGANTINTDQRCPFFEFPFPGKKTIAELPSPRLIKTHLPYSMLPNEVKTKKPKIIYIYRNPKDVVVSFYRFAIEFLAPINKFHGSFERYCELFTEDLVAYGPWWKHVVDAQGHEDEDNVLILSFEDLKKDLPAAVRSVATFLGKSLTEDQVTAVTKHCSFSSMKGNSTTNYTWLQDSGMADSNVDFMRKGKVGEWKNQLSDDIVAKLDEMVKTKVAPAGVVIQDMLDES